MLHKFSRAMAKIITTICVYRTVGMFSLELSLVMLTKRYSGSFSKQATMSHHACFVSISLSCFCENVSYLLIVKCPQASLTE